MEDKALFHSLPARVLHTNSRNSDSENPCGVLFSCCCELHLNKTTKSPQVQPRDFSPQLPKLPDKGFLMKTLDAKDLFRIELHATPLETFQQPYLSSTSIPSAIGRLSPRAVQL